MFIVIALLKVDEQQFRKLEGNAEDYTDLFRDKGFHEPAENEPPYVVFVGVIANDYILFSDNYQIMSHQFGGSAYVAAMAYQKLGKDEAFTQCKLFSAIGDEVPNIKLKLSMVSNKIAFNDVDQDPAQQTSTQLTFDITPEQAQYFLDKPSDPIAALEFDAQRMIQKFRPKNESWDFLDRSEPVIPEPTAQPMVRIQIYVHDIMQNLGKRFVERRAKLFNQAISVYSDLSIPVPGLMQLMQKHQRNLIIQGSYDQMHKYQAVMADYFNNTYPYGVKRADVENKTIVRDLILTMREAQYIQTHFCYTLKNFRFARQKCKEIEDEDLQIQNTIIYGYIKSNMTFIKYLESNEENISKSFNTLHHLTKANFIHVKLPKGGVVVSSDFGKTVKYVATNCGKKCAYSEHGIMESYAAGIMRAKIQRKDDDEELEYAAAVMTSSVIAWQNVNPRLNSTLIEQIREQLKIKVFDIIVKE